MHSDIIKPLVVTMGEPAGIGPDIILKAYSNRKSLNLPSFYVRGSKKVLNDRANKLDLNIDFTDVDLKNTININDAFSSQLPVMQTSIPCDCEVIAGKLSSKNSAFVIETIRQSVSDIYSGFASALVTAPIHKGIVYEAGFQFPGHTEYLASLASEFFKKTCEPVMMLASDELRVVPVTIHVPFQEVPRLLTKDLICNTIKIVANDLNRYFGMKTPHIIVTGLNPHAGEDGTIGRTEIEIIEPAINELQEMGINVTGPYSADTCFHPRARAKYDAAIAMYHDQALIPIKTLSFDEGVNLTLGLPFIRTSPDHGTALDIAGTGTAREESFIAALNMASKMAISCTKNDGTQSSIGDQ